MKMILRRVLAIVAAAALAVAGLAGAAQAQFAGMPVVPVDALMAEVPGGAPDIAIGSPDAPVTVIEYASITCPHCGAFHATTFPQLQADYIDTGRVRFIIREYPLDDAAVVIFMLARCIPDPTPERHHAFLGRFLSSQSEWYAPQMSGQQVFDAIIRISGEFGLAQEPLFACAENDDLFRELIQVALRGESAFGVNSTPTFFINGERVVGNVPYANLRAVIDARLAAAP